jgi:hypothetical protein
MRKILEIDVILSYTLIIKLQVVCYLMAHVKIRKFLSAKHC